jgi:hypothetical protein
MVTREAVPIVRVGTYPLSTGTHTFTEEDLLAAADALANDPAVKAPRVKIASVEKALGLDPMAHGGEPAFGYFDNLRVTENGQELLADFHGPESVAAAMEWAYPSLSIEGTPPGWESATGRKHDLVITAVALLGVHWPGVTTLDDFHEFLANGPTIERTEDAPETVLATMRQAPTPIAASLDQDLVGRRFYEALESGAVERPEGVESVWSLWIRSMRFDDTGSPYLKVTDEDSGRLYRVDFSVAGSEVTFGDWIEVAEQDVPVAAGAVRLSAPLASWASRDESRAAMAINPEEANPLTDEQRRAFAAAFGLPEDATAEQVEAAAAAAAEERAATPPAPEPTPEPVAPEPEPVAASAPSARVREVTEGVWAETQARLEAAERRLAERDAADQRAERDALIMAAVSDGRIAPAERDEWRRDLDEAPEATARAIGRLTPNRIPVEARGIDPTDARGELAGVGQGTGLFPELEG